MDLIVECPACKTALRIDPTLDVAHFSCPSCQQTFEVDQAKRPNADAETLNSGSQPLDPPIESAPIPKARLPKKKGSSGDPDFSPSTIGIKTGSKVANRPVRHRKKKDPLPLILGLVGLTIFVAVLGGIAVSVRSSSRQKQLAAAAVEKENEARAQQAAQSEQDEIEQAERERRRLAARTAKPTQEIQPPEPDVSPADVALPTLQPEPAPIDSLDPLLATLGGSGQLCEAFQFLPTSESQYKQLQTFANQLSLAKSQLADDQESKLDSDDRDAIQQELVRWQDTMKSTLASMATESPERLPQINAYAKRQFEKMNSLGDASDTNSPEIPTEIDFNDPLGKFHLTDGTTDDMNRQIIFYGVMFLGGEDEPNAILKFDRKQVYFSVPYNPEFGRLRDQTYRMFFVEIPQPPNQNRMNSPGGGLIKVSSVKLIDSFDPLPSPAE